MLAVPVAKQFEQVMNARYLEREGFGREAQNLEDPAVITRFLEAIPACAETLSHYAQNKNTLLLTALDSWLDKAAAGVA